MTSQPPNYDGTIVLFAGRGWVSRTIQIRTFSRYSHVGILAKVTSRRLEAAIAEGADIPKYRLEWLDAKIGQDARYVLFESTTMGAWPCVIRGESIEGVQAHWPLDRQTAYNGSTWLMPLRKQLDVEQSYKLTLELLKLLGTPYDGPGCLKAGTFLWRWLPLSRPDASSMFCAETVIDVLQTIRVLPPSDPETWTPASIYRRLTKMGVYLPPVSSFHVEG